MSEMEETVKLMISIPLYLSVSIFHCFVHRDRLKNLFLMLNFMFVDFKVILAKVGFIFGFKFWEKKRKKGQLVNFVIGKAKMAIYLTRKGKMDGEVGQDVVHVFKSLVRVRIKLDFLFYKTMNNIEDFENVWNYKEMQC